MTMPSQFFKSDFYPLIKLALPLALNSVLQSAIFFFETLFLARLGTEFIAAGALVSWLYGTLAVVLFGTMSSINIFISHHYGAKDDKAISLVLRDGLLLALVLSFLGVLLFWNMAPIFLLFGQSPSIVALAQSYLHPLAWGLLPNYIILALLEFIIGLGHARIILAYTFLSAVTSIVFSYIFIFGKFGLPFLKIAGAGWGMTLSNWVMIFFLGAYFFKDNTYKSYLFAAFTKAKPSYFWELVTVGLPIGLMYCIEVGFFLAMTLVMGSWGSAILAANQISLQYLGMFMNAAFALAQAITVRMGHLLGEKNLHAAKRVSFLGVGLSGFLMLLVAFCYWFAPIGFIAVDINVHLPANQKIVYYTEAFLFICAIFQILESLRIALFGALRALKDTRFTLFISILSFWFVALPLGYWLGKYMHWGGRGLWWGMVIGGGLSVLLLYWRFEIKMRSLIKHVSAC